MQRAIAGFDWDDGNRAKCQKHGVSTVEIEGLFARDPAILPDLIHSTKTESRFIAIGKGSRGRHIFMVFTLRTRDSRTYVRPISARYMHRKEVIQYEKENPDL